MAQVNNDKSEPEATVHGSGGNEAASANDDSPLVAAKAEDSDASKGNKPTGPRTELGKQRASRNATKHGLLSKVVVLPGESRAEYERLLTGLREGVQPEGALEELLVERLATIEWRRRRLLLSENAEIRKSKEFVEWDQRNRENEEAEELVEQSNRVNLSTFGPMIQKTGLVQKMHNPEVLQRCLELLSELREQIQENGLDRENDKALLQTLYGERNENRLREGLYEWYEGWLCTSEASEEERAREGYSSPEQCRENVIQEIEAEIRRLKRYQKARASIEASRTQLEVTRRSVPDGPGLDRLLRYEASLERSFDRTLSQLERLQRMRLGQPVLPKLEVQHSLS